MTVYVTFRMADSLPETKLRILKEEREAWLREHPEPRNETTRIEHHLRCALRTEAWLDQGYGSCALSKPKIRQVVEDTLSHFDQERYIQHAWVIMPNHVHALFTLCGDQTVQSVLHSWKSYTAHQLVKNHLLPNPFWQEDYFDRIVRDTQHFGRTLRYIRKNPAQCASGAYTHWEDPVYAAW